MKVDFYVEETTGGKQLVIVFEKTKTNYKQMPLGLIKDLKISKKDIDKLTSVYIDTDTLR